MARGADAAKDQSYVVHMLSQRQLGRTLFPVGHLTKAEVRRRADALGLRTAHKPDSQDVCFITHTGGREQFLGDRIAFRPATVVDLDGSRVGSVDAVELVTIGQRRGIGLPGGGPKRYVVDVDVHAGRVTVGGDEHLDVATTRVGSLTWAAGTAVDGGFVDATGADSSGVDVLVQCSAHGATRRAIARRDDSDASDDGVDGGGGIGVILEWEVPQRRVAPGQSVVLYDLDDVRVLGGGIAR